MDKFETLQQEQLAVAMEKLVRERLIKYDKISEFLYNYDPAVEDADAGPEYIAGAAMVIERIRTIITPEQKERIDDGQQHH